MSIPRRPIVLVGTVALTVAALAGPTVGSAASANTTVTVATLPQASFVPLYLGKKRGFYRDVGIDLQLNSTIPTTQLTSSLLANRVQFSGLSWGNLVSVRSNRIPLSGIANLSSAPNNTKKDDTELDVLASSNIKSTKDLAGKTIGVAVLNGLGEIVVRNLAAKAGVAQSSLKFVAVQFPDLAPALRAKRIDVAFNQEPFVTVVKSQTKIRRLAAGNSSFIPGLPAANIVATDAYIKSNGKLVDAFQKATIRSVNYSRKHPAEVRRLLPSVSGVASSITSKITLPTFSPKMDKGKIQRLANAQFRFAKIKSKVSANDMVKN